MRPDELNSIALQTEQMFYDLQDRVMQDIVRRIRKTRGITSTADYQINRLIDMGKTTEFIESEIKRLLGASNPQIWEMYDKVVDKEYVRNRDVYEQINGQYTPFEENHQLQSWVRAFRDQTNGEIKNLTQSLGFTIDMGRGKKVFTPLAEYYQKYLDRACMDIVTGTFDYGSVLRRVASEMSASGLRTVDYASGRSVRATAAARTAVMTGVNQLSARINLYNADQLGGDHFEITWHGGARPTHWWGGTVVTRSELETVCGYGDVGGLCGANCRHNFYVFFPGISVRKYTDEQLQEMADQETILRPWKGKEYNAYTATQKQREYERKMQVQRSKVVALKRGAGDDADVLAAQARYLHQLRDYRAFSRNMKLEPQMERVYVDLLGRVVPNKYSA